MRRALALQHQHSRLHYPMGILSILIGLSACGYYTDRDGDGVYLAPEFIGTALYDCDDKDPLLGQGEIFYLDADGDLLGDAAFPCFVCLGINPVLTGQTEQKDPEGCLGTYVFNPLDCRDSGEDPAAWGEGLWVYQDADGDGYGDPSLALAEYVCTDEVEVSEDRGYVRNALDCNDKVSDPTQPTLVFYFDEDRDGFGGNRTFTTCDSAATPPPDYQLSAGDCDDLRPDTFPGAPDCGTGNLANHDENCDGRLDDDDGQVWYRDADGDGWGVVVTSTLLCSTSANGSPSCLTVCPVGAAISSYVRKTGDCADDNPAVYPGAGC